LIGRRTDASQQRIHRVEDLIVADGVTLRPPAGVLHFGLGQVEIVLADLRQLVDRTRAAADKARSRKGQRKAHAPPQLPIPEHIDLRFGVNMARTTRASIDISRQKIDARSRPARGIAAPTVNDLAPAGNVQVDRRLKYLRHMVRRMTMRRAASGILAVEPIGATAAAAPGEDGQLVREVSNDGKVVVLEDGSVWVVDDMDMVVSVTEAATSWRVR
jgi:hypothetical protein